MKKFWQTYSVVAVMLLLYAMVVVVGDTTFTWSRPDGTGTLIYRDVAITNVATPVAFSNVTIYGTMSGGSLSTISCTGAAAFKATVVVDGATTLGGAVTASNTVTAANLSTTGKVSGSVGAFTGAFVIDGAGTVGGALVTSNTLTAANLSTTGKVSGSVAAFTGAAVIDGAATVGGALTVTGKVTCAVQNDQSVFYGIKHVAQDAKGTNSFATNGAILCIGTLPTSVPAAYILWNSNGYLRIEGY